MMSQPRKIKITDLNPHLICVLCGGYYVDATTIIECLHSFCKACIVRYLESNKYCPICDVQVHKTKPLQNIRTDQTLQNMVYKLVPGLFQNEMHRRREFYLKNPEASPLSDEDGGEITEQSNIFTPDESFSLSLEYLHSEKDAYSEDFSSRRFLRCPAAVTISHLQKLIRAKFGLTAEHRVDILYMGEALHENLTLMDVAYIYRWRRKGPLHLNYCIYESRIKRMKFEHNTVDEHRNAEETECPNPPKAFDLDIIDNFQIVFNTDGLNNLDCSTMKNLDTLSHDDNKNEWKEVQIQISENGIMSVTDISVEHNNNTDVPHDFEMPVVKDVQSKVCDASGNTYPSSVLSNVMNKDDLKSDCCKTLVKEGNSTQQEQEKLVQESIDRTSTPSNDARELPCVESTDKKTGTNFSTVCKCEVSSSLLLPVPLSVAEPMSSAVVTSCDKSAISKVGNSNLNVPKSECKTSATVVHNKGVGLCKPDEQVLSTSNEPMSSKNSQPEVKANMKRNISCREEIKLSVTSVSNGSNLNSASIKRQSHAASAPVGYKTLKAPPKSWNPSITHPNIQTTKFNSFSCASGEGSSFYGKGTSGNGKICSSVTVGNPTLKPSAENTVSSAKPARIFKTRNVPRYLGNPASGVKPMFQAVTVASTSSSKADISPSKPSGLTVTKIDPKTLSPIIVGSSSTPLCSTIISSTIAGNSLVPTISSTGFSPSVIPSNTKTHVPYSQLQSPFASLPKGNVTTSSQIVLPSNNTLASSSKTAVSVGGLIPRNSCQATSTTTLLSNIPKNAPHLLYVFSGGSNKFTNSSFPRTGVGSHVSSTAIGAFHPLPPSVNMLFNPHNQHHRLHNQCVSTTSQTLTTPSIQRIPASNFHQKFGTGNTANGGISNKGGCNNSQGKVKEDCEGKESFNNYSFGINSSNSSSMCLLSNCAGDSTTLNCRTSADFRTGVTTTVTNTVATANVTSTTSATTTFVTVINTTNSSTNSSSITPTTVFPSSTIFITAVNSSATTTVTSNAVKTTAANSTAILNGIATSVLPEICVGSSTTTVVTPSTLFPVSAPVVCTMITNTASSHNVKTAVSSTYSSSAITSLAGISTSGSMIATPSKIAALPSSAAVTNLISSMAPMHNISPAPTFTAQCNTSLKSSSTIASSPFSSSLSTCVAPIPPDSSISPLTFPCLYKNTCASLSPNTSSIASNISSSGLLSPISTTTLIHGSGLLSVPIPVPSLKITTAAPCSLSHTTTTTASNMFVPSHEGNDISDYNAAFTTSTTDPNIVTTSTTSNPAVPTSTVTVVASTSDNMTATTTAGTLATMPGNPAVKVASASPLTVSKITTALTAASVTGTPTTTIHFGNCANTTGMSSFVSSTLTSVVPAGKQAPVSSSSPCSLSSSLTLPQTPSSSSSSPSGLPSFTSSTTLSSSSTCTLLSSYVNKPLLNICTVNPEPKVSLCNPLTEITQSSCPSFVNIECHTMQRLAENSKRNVLDTICTTNCSVTSSNASITSSCNFSIDNARVSLLQSDGQSPSNTHKEESRISATEQSPSILSTTGCEERKLNLQNVCTEESCSMTDKSVQLLKEGMTVCKRPCEEENDCGKTVADSTSKLPEDVKKEETIEINSNIESLKDGENKLTVNVSVTSKKREDSVLCTDAASGMQCNNNCADFKSSESDSCKLVALNNREQSKHIDMCEKYKDSNVCSEFSKVDNKVSTPTKVADSITQAAPDVEKIVHNNEDEQLCSKTLTAESTNDV